MGLFNNIKKKKKYYIDPKDNLPQLLYGTPDFMMKQRQNQDTDLLNDINRKSNKDCGNITHSEQLINIFEDTMNQIKINPILAAHTAKAKVDTVLYPEGFYSKKRQKYDSCNITVMESRSLKAAEILNKEFNRIAVLNFASAVNPGGGVTVGAIAQEESLCRVSNLYPCLNQPEFWSKFYQYHRNQTHKNYSDRIIYSKGITVFKTDEDYPQYTDEWYSVDIITSPAPNLTEVENLDWNELTNLFSSRIRNILEIAMENEVQALVLGAFGCGAFKNPPALVALIFKDILEKLGYKYYFKEIIFAIKRSNDWYCENLAEFERTFHILSEECNKRRFWDTGMEEFVRLRMPSGQWASVPINDRKKH